MCIKKILTALVISLSFNVYGADEGKAILEAQKKKLEEIAIDMNQSGRELYDTFSNNPQKVAESGCLDNIRAISADAIVIDPMNILGAVYAALKDELKNQACSAATDFANKLSDELDYKLTLPYDIGSLEVGGDGSVTNDGVFKPNVELDNEKVANDVTKSVLEKARNKKFDAKSGVKRNSRQEFIRSQKANNSKDVEKKLEDIIDLDRFFGAEKKEGEGNNE